MGKEDVVRTSRSRRIPILWLLPALLLVLFFVIYPLWSMILASFSTLSFAGVRTGWAGFDNYIAVLNDPVIPQVLRTTAIWTIGVVVGTLAISLVVALVLNETWPGRRFVRWVLIIPWATSLVITSLAFRWILDSQLGTLNILLQDWGVIDEPLEFLSDASRSIPLLILVGIFVSVPFTTYVLLSGLQGIPNELYEAARIDGASAVRRFRKITLPLLSPFVTLAALLNAIYVFNSFPIIWILTQGGPLDDTQTVITYTYKLAFSTDEVAKAAALASASLVFLAVVGTIYWLVLRRQRAA
jgi:ABC-type glycerol-3-phosphate transport system permease component